MLRIKDVVRHVFRRCGYDVRPIASGSGPIRKTLGECYAHLKSCGFEPGTLVDVGVATGTPELYEVFPDAHFVLIEPLKAFEDDVKRILRRYDGEYVLAAAGADTGEVTFNVHAHQLDGSSTYKESMGSVADGEEMVVPQVRVDDVVKEKGGSVPYLIKIDVQGAELDVLDGASEILGDTEVVVLEVSLFEFMKGAPQLDAVIAYMKARGFVTYDLVHGWNRPLDNALGQVDIVFVRQDGPFRAEHGYARADQLKKLDVS